MAEQITFSFDSQTLRAVQILGVIPSGCYGTPEDRFIPEHAEKNRVIVRQYIRDFRKQFAKETKERISKQSGIPKSKLVIRPIEPKVDWGDL